MENKRKKALGLMKQIRDTNKVKKEEPPKKSNKLKSIKTSSVSRIQEEQISSNVDQDSSCVPSDCIKSECSTPKRRIPVVQSPDSPGLESMFPRMLGSPEIEVSWDWGCSQIPKDMLPSRKKKLESPKQPLVVLSPLIQGPRVFQVKQISEEENQARLAFYKNVLSQASKCKIEDDIKSSKLDNQDHPNHSSPKCSKSLEEDEKPICNGAHPNLTTPKRSTKSLNRDKASLSSLFDDSVNELMLECSQMVEEQLKNGQVVLDSVVSINIPHQKHDLSPDLQQESTKRPCPVKSKLSLKFIDSPKNTNTTVKSENLPSHLESTKIVKLNNHPNYVLKSHLDNSNGRTSEGDGCTNFSPLVGGRTVNNTVLNKTNSCQNDTNNVERAIQPLNGQYRPEVLKQVVNSNRVLPKQQTSVNNNTIQSKQSQVNVNNMKYDSVDKFRRVSKSVCDSNQNENICRVNTVSSHGPCQTKSAITHSFIDESKTSNKRLTNNVEEAKNHVADVSSLLDDGFDMELSTLDVDSICRNSQIQVKPRVCSKAEIEAKRRLAVTRLKMKMRR